MEENKKRTPVDVFHDEKLKFREDMDEDERFRIELDFHVRILEMFDTFVRSLKERGAYQTVCSAIGEDELVYLYYKDESFKMTKETMLGTLTGFISYMNPGAEELLMKRLVVEARAHYMSLAVIYMPRRVMNRLVTGNADFREKGRFVNHYICGKKMPMSLRIEIYKMLGKHLCPVDVYGAIVLMGVHQFVAFDHSPGNKSVASMRVSYGDDFWLASCARTLGVRQYSQQAIDYANLIHLDAYRYAIFVRYGRKMELNHVKFELEESESYLPAMDLGGFKEVSDLSFWIGFRKLPVLQSLSEYVKMVLYKVFDNHSGSLNIASMRRGVELIEHLENFRVWAGDGESEINSRGRLFKQLLGKGVREAAGLKCEFLFDY
jgi:hypothetical protein